MVPHVNTMPFNRFITITLLFWSASSNTSNAFASPQKFSTSSWLRLEDNSSSKKKNDYLSHLHNSKTPKRNNEITSLAMISSVTNALSNTSTFWKTNGIYAASSVVGYVISVLSGSHVHLDLIGTGAFGLGTLPSLFRQKSLPIHTLWSSYAIALWSFKLAGFLFFRAIKVGHDKRLEELLLTSSGAFQFWFISFVWNMVSSMPYLLGFSRKYAAIGGRNGGDVGFVKVGGLVYLLGFSIETISDVQKWVFKQRHADKFCDIGLWSLSQHPNYFGNLLVWIGILIMNVPWLIDLPLVESNTKFLFKAINWVWRCRRLLLSLISPLFLWSLFNSQASGTMTNSLELAKSKYGTDPRYQSYQSEVPLIIPKLFRK